MLILRRQLHPPRTSNKRPVERRATLSQCGRYRYFLSRVWDVTKPTLGFIMLNPSTADDVRDDPTIHKCMGFANRWGYGRIEVVNLFAYRATNPKVLRDMSWSTDIVGGQNDEWIKQIVIGSGATVCAWGNAGAVGEKVMIPRRLQIAALLGSIRNPKLLALDVTKAKQPKHPLYVPYDIKPKMFVVESEGDYR